MMHSKGDNMEIMINYKAGEVTEELFKLLIRKNQIGLEKSTRGSYFIFDRVHLFYYKCHEINPNRGGSYINSPINKKDNKCFQYAVIVVLNHE